MRCVVADLGGGTLEPGQPAEAAQAVTERSRAAEAARRGPGGQGIARPLDAILQALQRLLDQLAQAVDLIEALLLERLDHQAGEQRLLRGQSLDLAEQQPAQPHEIVGIGGQVAP